jgi:hypothetical protein
VNNYVHLIGSEHVQTAGHRIVEAARTMESAASSIHESQMRQQEFMWQWLEEFKNVLRENLEGER